MVRRSGWLILLRTLAPWTLVAAMVVSSGCFHFVTPDIEYEAGKWTIFLVESASSGNECLPDTGKHAETLVEEVLSFNLSRPANCMSLEAGRLQVESQSQTYRLTVDSNQNTFELRIGGDSALRAAHFTQFPSSQELQIPKGATRIYLNAGTQGNASPGFWISVDWQPVPG